MKRKNDQPIPRRYWWIFGILALVLLIPFRTPENMLITFFGYVVMFFVVGNVTVEFVRNHGIRYLVIVLALGCMMLPFAQLYFITQHEPFLLFVECERKQEGILTISDCIADCYFENPLNADVARYVTIFRLPVSVLIQPIWDKDFPAVCARIY